MFMSTQPNPCTHSPNLSHLYKNIGSAPEYILSLEGWGGPGCSTDIDECSSNPCGNNGDCTDRLNGYTCTCHAGFIGDHCQTNIDECSSSPCQNGGNCTDGVNGYSCQCVDGYSGSRCETDVRTTTSSTTTSSTQVTTETSSIKMSSTTPGILSSTTITNPLAAVVNGTISLLLTRFINPSGLLSNGLECETTSGCDHSFKFCFDVADGYVSNS